MHTVRTACLSVLLLACFFLTACTNNPPQSGSTALPESIPIENADDTLEENGSIGIIGGADGPTAIYTTSGAPTMDSLGRYCPDGPIYQEDFYDESYQAELKASTENIGEEHQAMLAQLQEGYQERTSAAQLELLYQLCEQDDSFHEAVATVTYSGMYDNYHQMDDFYTSLYFTLQQYYQDYGPENVQDNFYMFSYQRLLSGIGVPNGGDKEKNGDEDFDWDDLLFFSYACGITYHSPETTTIAERDKQLAMTIMLANSVLDGYSVEDWKSDSCKQQIEQDLSSVFASMADAHLTFTLLDVNYYTDDLQE